MIQKLFSRLALLLLIGTPFLTLVPVYAEASTTPSVPGCTATTAYSPLTGVKCPTAGSTTSSAAFDASSMVVASGAKASLTGTADVSKIRLSITASTTDKTLYKSGRVSVRSGEWHVNVSKRLPDGTYTVTLFQDNKGKLTQLTTGTLYVGVQPVTLKVLPIALLAGGTARAGSTQPISYLEVVNESNATTTIAGFWVKENGNAPENAIIGFSSVDDKGNYRVSTGGIEGQTPFVNGQAYVPSGAVLAPHQMKLFTIKAQLSAYAGQYAGTNLMLDVAGVDAPASFAATFPIRGTTWVITQ